MTQLDTPLGATPAGEGGTNGNGGGAGVPFAMRDRLHVPKERYYDRSFFELEKERLWPKTWQMACRLEEIPHPGDFAEYEICDQSIVVVRQDDMSVKAFYNACRHRATELCKGSGRLAGGQFVCPFHGWRWNTDGSSSFVYGAEGFDNELLDPADLALTECKVEIWGAGAWINMDPDAPPLRDYLSPAASALETVGVDDFRVYWWKEIVLNCNWKVALEAFQEGWHVMATHPQLTMGAGEAYPTGVTEYTPWENGHGRFWGKFNAHAGGIAEGRGAQGFLDRSRMLWSGQDAMILERDLHAMEGLRTKVPEGVDYPTEAIKGLIDYDLGAGVPIRTEPDAVRLWGGMVFLFPNLMYLPMYSNALCYRSRPYNDDPEWCRFEVWSLTMPPAGQEVPRARLKGRFDKDDAENWGRIPRQDFGNVERQQRGLHTRTYRANRLATEWESIIANMHVEIDRYLVD